MQCTAKSDERCIVNKKKWFVPCPHSCSELLKVRVWTVQSKAVHGARTVQSPACSWVRRDVPSANLDHVLVGGEKELGGVGHIRGRVGSDPRVALGLGREREQEGLPRAEVCLLTLLPLGRAVGPKALCTGKGREHVQRGLGTLRPNRCHPKIVRCMKSNYCETPKMHPWCRNQHPIPTFKFRNIL